ncbi:MAG: ribonuclease Z [Lactobacillales bacterium]|jgi:ribonuclease Z|nr:ribonuclease Z [Lactobacillales bacterium]
MQLQFLGTGAGVPSKFRNMASTALKLLDELNEVWLFDAGEGAQLQILKTNLRPRKIKKIFITHLHSDHLLGLVGLLGSRSFQEGTDPVDIYGPKGVREYVQTSMRITRSTLTYQINYHEFEASDFDVKKLTPLKIIDDKKFTVYALPLDHTVFSVGYRVVEHDHEPELLIEKVRAAQIPEGPVYAQLKRGETVTLEDGRTFDGHEFIGAAKKGKIVTILGDTRQAAASVVLAQDADVLVHEATYQDSEVERKKARNHGHSTGVQAAEVALQARAKTLLLTHFSARYFKKDIDQIGEDARRTFPNAFVMQDLEEFEIDDK